MRADEASLALLEACQRFWQPPLRAFQAEGIAAFILSFYPHMAEADLFARHVLPQMQHGPLEL